MKNSQPYPDLTENPSGKYNGNELRYVAEALDSSNPKNKEIPWTVRLEREFCKAVGSRYAVAHNSGTSALHSCLAAAGVGPGDEVISPALTVVMDSMVTVHLGATPVFADVNRQTHNIDPEDVRRKITPKTKAIMTVSLQGLPADAEKIMAIAKERNLLVVEDCAQTLLGKVSGKVSGTIGHLGIFSFENKKHLSTGEGGIVVTDDENLAQRVRKFGGIGYKNLTAEHGRMSILPDQFQDPNFERFDSLGLNYRMPEVCAAVGLAQLERVHLLLERRKKCAAMYAEALAGCSWMVPQVTPPGYEHVYYTYAVEYFGDQKHKVTWREFWRKLKDLGGDGFYGACKNPYLEPVFQNGAIDRMLGGKSVRYEKGLCPVAEALQPRVMQFKTNYRDLDVAKKKIGLLAQLVDSLGRP